MLTEVEDNSVSLIRGIDQYLTLREITTGVTVVLRLTEFDLKLPIEVLQHPIVVSLVRLASEIIGLINVRLLPCMFNFSNVDLRRCRTYIRTAGSRLKGSIDTTVSPS